MRAPAPPVAASLTLGEAATAAASRLAASGIDSPRREARLLVALAAAIAASDVLLYPERPLPPAARLRLEPLLARRAAREPMARIAGRREFWSLDFALSPATLDPRPDSETLIAASLALLPDRAAPLRILDLGTGTGCLMLALLSELGQATGLGIDIDPGAVAVARRNATAIGLESRAFFAVGWWGAAVAEGIDVILANPPYVATAAIAALAPEVALYEPRVALDGGADGLAAYRELAPQLARLLKATGFAALEIGAGQEAAVAAICAQAGLDIAGRRTDLGGVARCLVAAPRR